MYQKIRSDEMADLEFDLDLDLLDPALMDFTPTTINRMENTLMNLDGAYDNDSDSESAATDDSNQDWTYSPTDAGQHEATASSGGRAAQKRKLQEPAAGVRTRQLPGPKSSRRIEDMTPAEINRRERRRDRNKAAASRCRQRRLDLTNQLLLETQQLEAEGQRLEREIENLSKQRDQLEFVLGAHEPMCHVTGSASSACAGIKFEPISVEASTASTLQLATPSPVRPNSLSLAAGGLTQSSTLDFGSFNLGSTGSGWTPIVSASGLNLFMGADAGLLSPTTLLGSPASTLFL